MKNIVIIVVTVFLFLACTENGYEKKRKNNYIVKAKFINDSLIDGTARFYNLNGELESKANFMYGKKSGYAVNYYKNGSTRDSINYADDLVNGDAYKFDSSGLLLYRSSNFYGVNVGDNVFYKNGKIQEYYFTDFGKVHLVESLYDSLERCNSLFFNAAPVVTNFLIEKETPALGMLIYFPHPPGFEVKYTIGLINNHLLRKNEVVLNSDRLLLDTTLSIPEKNSDYFISVDYKNLSSDSTFNIYFKKLIPHTPERIPNNSGSEIN